MIKKKIYRSNERTPKIYYVTLVCTLNLQKPACISYFWAYDLYGPVHNAFDAGIFITRASWRGLGPGNRDSFGPCEMALSRQQSAVWDPKKSRFPGPNRLPLPASKALSTGPINHRLGSFLHELPRGTLRIIKRSCSELLRPSAVNFSCCTAPPPLTFLYCQWPT
jgi:hypothetical protein